MSLFDELIVATGNPTTGRCTVARILEAFPPEDVADLQRALAAPKHLITSVAIADKLSSMDVAFRVKGQTVARHRRGACSCG